MEQTQPKEQRTSQLKTEGILITPASRPVTKHIKV